MIVVVVVVVAVMMKVTMMMTVILTVTIDIYDKLFLIDRRRTKKESEREVTKKN